MRPWLAWSTLLFVAATARPAAAETQLNGGTVKIDFYIPKDQSKVTSTDAADYTLVDPTATTTPVAFKRYFNGARCTCDQHDLVETSPQRQLFLMKLSFDGTAPSLPGTVPLDVYAGTSCDTATANERPRSCSLIHQFSDAAALSRVQSVFVRTHGLMASGTDSMNAPNACGSLAKSTLSVTSGTTPPLFVEMAGQKGLEVPFDQVPPEMPTSITPTGLEKAIRLAWDVPSASIPDGYQALCIRADELPAHVDDQGNPVAVVERLFDSTADLCSLPIANPPEKATLADDSAEEGMPPAPLMALDARYLCGQADSSTAGSITLEELENGVAYWVVLVAYDKAGNYDAIYVPRTVTPQPTTDFWEDANQENPGIQGGFCVSQVGRDGGVGVLLVVGASMLALRRRRRRTGRGAALVGLGLGLGLLVPGLARAQAWDPYWVDADAAATEREEVSVWHLGLRLGPYHPSVDEGFTSDPGPYRRMFGPGYNLVPQLDLHRIWQLRGVQLGLGGSAGYYQKSADVFAERMDPSEPLTRVEGATNTFKMIPLSLTGTVRVTGLDDAWGLPVVPYLRGGLAYNVWWLRTPTGDLAVACDGCKDKALGASAGLVGAVGLSIRAERIDPSGAASMRNGGVEHAGFYAEFETSWVDGFGNAKRLSLGDTTWYAGVDFEF